MHPDPAGVVHVLCADPAGTLYAGCGGGVVRSTDGGRHWELAADGLSGRRIFALAATPAGKLFAGSYDGVWFSVDGGRQWTPTDIGMSGSDTFAVAIAPTGDLAAAGAGGAWTSADRGESWAAAGSGLSPYAGYGWCWLDSGDALLATDDGVYRRTGDAGDWSPSGLRGKRAYVVGQPAAHVVLAGTLGAGLYRSVDDGHRWTGCAEITDPLVFDLLRTRSGHLLVTTGDPGSGIKRGGIFRSTDDGAQWQRLTTPAMSVYGVAEDGAGRLYAAAQRCTVLRSEDGGNNWLEFSAPGSGTDKSYAIAVDRDGRVYLGTDAGVFRSDDQAVTWADCSEGLAGATPYALCTLADGTVFAATTRGVLRRTDTSGWQ